MKTIILWKTVFTSVFYSPQSTPNAWGQKKFFFQTLLDGPLRTPYKMVTFLEIFFAKHFIPEKPSIWWQKEFVVSSILNKNSLRPAISTQIWIWIDDFAHFDILCGIWKQKVINYDSLFMSHYFILNGLTRYLNWSKAVKKFQNLVEISIFWIFQDWKGLKLWFYRYVGH